ncbi:MAG: hypothetical protein K2K63_04995 [Acetatifactor sp.]|nr:hypothetical protein [Acetatifactor sp.]
MAKENKIKKYRKPLNLNIGMIIFGVIFIYVIVCVIMYFQTSHIVRYEVQEGSLAVDNVYRGVIIRDETVMYNQAAGYVNYYAREGERLAKNSLVYIVDETGRLSEAFETANLEYNSLSNKDLAEFRSEIVNFVHSYDSTYYESVYDFKYALKNTVLKLANANMLENIGDLNSAAGAGIINYAYTPITGIVSYWVDGYEDLKAQNVTAETFDTRGSNYEKKQMLSNSLMAVNDPVYKLCTNENWSLVIPVDAARGARLLQEEYVKVRFLKNQYESWGQVSMLTNADGNTYLKLDFNNSMITFINDRFLDIELIVEDETGLKIPLSSIVQKDFFLIPEDFLISSGNNGEGSIMRQCYLEDGTISSERLDIEVYNYSSETQEYYLDSSILNAGDILYKLDGQETYIVSKRATLIGVYNMNKGYADFKQINILYQNDEYAIVKSNTKYGLNVYDYIVLDAASVTDDQFIQYIQP